MAWPFSNSSAPNKDSGFAAVPLVAAAPATYDLVTGHWLLGYHFANGDQANDIYVYLLDGAGNPVMPGLRVPAGDVRSGEWAFMPATGLQWYASRSNLFGKVWGYA